MAEWESAHARGRTNSYPINFLFKNYELKDPRLACLTVAVGPRHPADGCNSNEHSEQVRRTHRTTATGTSLPSFTKQVPGLRACLRPCRKGFRAVPLASASSRARRMAAAVAAVALPRSAGLAASRRCALDPSPATAARRSSSPFLLAGRHPSFSMTATAEVRSALNVKCQILNPKP
jgi:hypothetical protein